IELVAVDGDVRCAPGMWRRLYDADEAPLTEIFGSDLGPILAAIACDVNQAVVCARPDDAFFDRRFGDSEDGVVILDACVVLRERATGGLLLAFVVASEVAADGRPRHSAIGGFENGFAAVINDLGIVGRNVDGGSPLK